MPDIHQTIMLARAFGGQVQAEFTPRVFRQICERNKTHYAEDDTMCATHDFADANMLMLGAFRTTMGREPAFLVGDAKTPDELADLRLWNDAWAVAKAAEFFA